MTQWMVVPDYHFTPIQLSKFAPSPQVGADTRCDLIVAISRCGHIAVHAAQSLETKPLLIGNQCRVQRLARFSAALVSSVWVRGSGTTVANSSNWPWG